MSAAIVRAAGAVVWRYGADGGVEVALVHRPRYDDWSFPKGKLDPGETVIDAAVREVREETGLDVVLGRFLGRVRYRVSVAQDGEEISTDKTVDYFSALARKGEFVATDEVDELHWASLSEAAGLLDRETDVELLREFQALPAETTTVLLVRHAKAGKRGDWDGDDDLRPLSEAGIRQSAALRSVLRHFAPTRVLSAPRVRCVQTVQTLAEELGVEVGIEPLLSEEGYWADPQRGLGRLLEIAALGGTTVISSQGGVIPDLVGTLAVRDDVPPAVVNGDPLPFDPDALRAKKASIWLLSFSTGPEPQLLAASYLATPLPAPEPSQG